MKVYLTFYWSAEPQRRAAKHLGHTWCVGKRFCKCRCVIISTLSSRIETMEFRKRRTASPSAPYPQELNSPWKKTIVEPIHMSTAEKSGRPERDQDLRCQSGPSAKNSVIFSGGDSSKNYGADQQRLQISDLHFDKFPTPAWKIRFKTEVCNCSQFTTEAMQWIKEVKLVDSVNVFLNLHHQQEVFQCQILKYPMRGLLQH